NPRPLIGRSRISLRRDGAGIGILIRLNAGESDVWIRYAGQPRKSEQHKNPKEQTEKLVHATVTSGVLSIEVWGTSERLPTRPGSRSINPVATAKVTLAAKMISAARD